MRLKTAIVAAAVGLLAQGAVLASPDTLIEALDHPEFAQRERATQHLTEAIGGDLKRLEAMIRDRELSPEQYARLEAVGWKIFRRGPRGALGVNIGDTVTRGVRIGDPVQGFNAAEVLVAADVIVEMDGHEVDSIATMRYLIVARDPGDVMRLKVVRQGREIDARVQMGSFEQFDPRQSQMEPGVLEGAWGYRVRSWPMHGAESAAEVRFAGPPPKTSQVVPLTGYNRWLAEGEALPPPMVAGGEAGGGFGACGRILVRIADTDHLLAPVPRGIEALRARSQTVMAEVLTNELSQTSNVLNQQREALAARHRESTDEDDEGLTEAIREIDERLRILRARSTEAWDLHHNLQRSGR